mmetsp:Transcript_76585/g.199079  ORF Transcript_76585/g.199079 Transcript_76585/m.199079 type:complete len:263 (+) Transcript_76585:1649-2437(+)
MIVAGPEHGNATSRDLREKVGCRIESRLPALLELKSIDVRRSFPPHAHVEACEDVFAQVDHRRTLAHTSTVPCPKTIQKVWVAVVHAHAQAAKEALVDCPECPFGCGVTLADRALAACVDIFAEAQVSAAWDRPVVLVQGHERAQDIRHFEAFTDECSHIAIQSLHVVAGSKTQAVELIASLALRLEVSLTEPQRKLAWQDLHDPQGAASLVPPALDACLLEGPRSVATPHGEKVLNHLPEICRATLFQIKDQVDGVVSIPL